MADNDFKIILEAMLDEINSKTNINTNISALEKKIDNIKIKATLDPNTIKELGNEIQKIVEQKITISNIGVNTGQIQRTGQQVGKLISDSAEKAINNVSSTGINKYFKIDSSTSTQFKKEMENLVSTWTSAKGKLTDIKIDTRTTYDKDAEKNIKRLHQATVTYKNELDEVIKKTIAWRQIGTTTNSKGDEEILRGFVEVAGQYSKAIDSVNVKTDNFAKKQKEVANDLKNTIEQLKSNSLDPNASKAISTQSGKDAISLQYQNAIQAVNDLKQANSSTFTDAKIKVNDEISALKILISQTKNAESVATSLRTKDFGTVKTIQTEKLSEFKNKIKASKVPMDELQTEVDSLNTSLINAFDSKSLTEFLNQLDIAKAKFNSLKAEFSNKSNAEIANIRADSLTKDIGKFQSDNDGIDSFTAEINGANVSVKSLLEELSKINNTGDVSVITEKWRAYTSAAKEAGLVTNQTALSQKQLTLFESNRQTSISSLENYFTTNSKLMKDNSNDAIRLREELKRLQNQLKELGAGDQIGLTTLKQQISTTKGEVKALGLEGRSVGAEVKNMLGKFSGWFGISQVVMTAVSKIGESVNEIKEIDTTLTEISKTSDRTAKSLKNLGDISFESASKYGVKANDYLLGVQEMSRAGFNEKTSEKMAELSTLTQSAGDITAELANQYLIASDAAYGYHGNVEKLNALLDSQNQVTNRNAVNMEELANATKIVALQASQAGISEQNLTALLSTMISTTQQGGEIAARSLKGIIMNLQQVSGELDGEEINEESFAKVEKRLHSVGVATEEVSNGIATLRDPIKILDELANVYNSLPDNNADKAGIIADLGGKYRGGQLSALLAGWDKYKKILGDYENASGSASSEAEKTANSLEGSLNKLSNTWTDTVENIADSDTLTSLVNLLNDLLDVINKITSVLGGAGTLGLIGGGILNANNFGIFKTFNGDINKISTRWGVFGRSFNDIGSAVLGRIEDINDGFKRTGKLIGSFGDSDSILKRLYPTKESIKNKLVDVDVLYPDVDDSFFTGIIDGLKEQQSFVDANKSSWTEYFNDLKEGEKWQIKFVQNTDLQTASLGDVRAAYDNARKSAIRQNEALQLQTLGAKAATLGMKALSVAANMALSIGLAFAIQGIATGIDYLIHRNEKLIESANEVKKTYQDSTKEIQDQVSSLKGKESDFSTLAKGVDEYGKNIGLSADEYERYKSIVSEVLGYTPDLIAGYDEEGNAIAKKNGLIEQSIQLLKDERKQKLKEITSDDNTKKITKGARAEYNEKIKEKQDLRFLGNLPTARFIGKANDEIDSRFSTKSLLDSALLNITGEKYDPSLENWENYLKRYKDIITKNYDSIRKVLQAPLFTNDGHILGLSKEDADDTTSWLDNYYKSISSVDKVSHGMDDQFQLFAQLSDSYDDLTDSQKNFVTEYIKSTGSIVDENGKSLSDDKIQDMANEYTDFVDQLGKNADAQNLINNLFSLSDKDLSVDEYVKEYRDIVNSIIDSLDLSDVQAEKIKLGFTADFDSLEETYDEAIKFATDKFKDLKSEDLEKFFSDNSVNTEDEIKNWNELANSYDNAAEAMEHYTLVADAAKAGSFNVESFSKEIDNIQSAYSSLSSAVEEYNEHKTFSLDTMQTLLALDPEYLAMLQTENGQITLNKQAIEEKVKAQIEEAKSQLYGSAITELNALAEQKRKQATYESQWAVEDSVAAIDEQTKALGGNTAAKMMNAAADASKAGVSEEEIAAITEKYTNMITTLQTSLGGTSFDSDGVMGGFDKTSGKADKANDKIKEITDSLEDLEKEHLLTNLKYEIDNIEQSIEELNSQLDLLNDLTDMTFEDDYLGKIQRTGKQYQTTAQYASELAQEMDTLLSKTPNNADEAETLSSSLDGAFSNYIKARKDMLEYQKALIETRSEMMKSNAEQAGDKSNRNLELVNNMARTEDNIKNGFSVFDSMLIPDVTKSAIEKQREEDEQLIALEQAYQDKITEIQRTAIEMRKAQDDAEYEEKKQDYYNQIAEAESKASSTGSSSTGSTSASTSSSDSTTQSKADAVSDKANNTNIETDNIAQNFIDNFNTSLQNLAGQIVLDPVKNNLMAQINDASFYSSINDTTSSKFTDWYDTFIANAKAQIDMSALVNSVFSDLPEAFQEQLISTFGEVSKIWADWIAQPENQLQAYNLMQNNGYGSWDVLSKSVKEIISGMGITTKSQWNEFVAKNPLQALQLLVTSWESLKQTAQKYMTDLVAIANNGANAIHNIKIQAPQISNESFANLQTLVANKIQEIFNVINDTFSQNKVDLNFNVKLSGNEQTNPQGDGSGSATGNAVVNSARTFLGVPYKYGGTSPSGFDCSGLMQHIFSQNGVTIPRVADDQFHGKGTAISSMGGLQAGDMVFFGSGDYASHVGLYIGNGKMIHAPHTGDVVKEADIANSDYYQSKFLGGKRVLNAYATGTEGAKAGLAEVGEQYKIDGSNHPTPEIVITNGKAYLAGTQGSEVWNLKSGDTVIPYEQTKKIINGVNHYAKGTDDAKSINPSSDQVQKTWLAGADFPKGLGSSIQYEGITRDGWWGPSLGTIAWDTDTGKLFSQIKDNLVLDSHGVWTYNGVWVGATTKMWGNRGDVIKVTHENGSSYPLLLFDTKSEEKTWYDGNPANQYGHDNGQCIVELTTDRYDHPYKNMNDINGSPIVKIENLGGMNGIDFSGIATSGNNSVSSKLAEALAKLKDVFGTYTTNTNTGKSTVAPYKSLGNIRQSSYSFSTPFTSKATGGKLKAGQTALINDANLLKGVNKPSPELVIDKNGKGSIVNGGNPTFYKAKGGETVVPTNKLNSFTSYAEGTDNVSTDNASTDDKSNDTPIQIQVDDLTKAIEALTDDIAKSSEEFQKGYSDLAKSFSNDSDKITEQWGNWVQDYAGHDTGLQELSKITHQAVKLISDNTIKVANLSIDNNKEILATLQDQYQVALDIYNNAEFSSLSADDQKAAIDSMTTIKEKMQTIQKNQSDLYGSIATAITQQGNYDILDLKSDVSFIDKDVEEIQNKIDKSDDTAEKLEFREQLDSLYASKIAKQEEIKTTAHQNAEDLRNNDIFKELTGGVPIDELFDADNEFNGTYQEILNSFGNDVDSAQKFIKLAEEMQQQKKNWTAADEEELSTLEAKESLYQDKVNDKIEAYVNYQERVVELMNVRHEKEQAVISALQAENDLSAQIRDKRAEITEEVEANKNIEDWLSEDTRKTLFNEDDYSAYSKQLNSIQSQMSKAYSEYTNKINSLSEKEMYKADSITDAYNQQVDILKEKLDLAGQNLSVAKKQAEYDNRAKERDTRVIIGGKLRQVANPTELYNLAKEKAQLETKITNTLANNADNQKVRNLQTSSEETKLESEALSARIDMINNFTDKEKKAFANFIEPIESITAKFENLWKTDMPWLVKSDNTDNVVGSMSDLEVGNGYDVGYDYAKSRDFLKYLYNNDIINKDTFDTYAKKADNLHNYKTSTNPYTAGYEQFTDHDAKTYDEDLIKTHSDIIVPDNVLDKQYGYSNESYLDILNDSEVYREGLMTIRSLMSSVMSSNQLPLPTPTVKDNGNTTTMSFGDIQITTPMDSATANKFAGELVNSIGSTYDITKNLK